MRLPFDQTNLQRPSQNRLSPVFSPRTEPLDLQTSANYAKLESLKQLGKGIFSIGDAIFQNYSRDIQDEKKRKDLLIQYDLNEFSAEQKRNFETDPPESLSEAYARISDGVFGTVDQPGFAKKLADKYEFSEKEMEVYLRKYEVQNRLVAMAQQTQRENESKVFQTTTKLDQGLTDFQEGFDLNQYEGLSKTELAEALDTQLLDIWNSSTSGLNPVLKQRLEIETYEDLKKLKQGYLAQYDAKVLEENQAELARKVSKVLSQDLDREAALSEVSRILNKAEENGLINEKEKVDRFLTAQTLYDRTLFERLKREDPERLLEMFQEQKEGGESLFPGISPLERQQKLTEIIDVIRGNKAEGLGRVRKGVDDVLNEVLNPNTDQAALELFFESEVSKLPAEEQPVLQIAFDYAKRLRGRIPDVNKTNLLYLETQLLESEPAMFDESGGKDPSVGYKRTQLKRFKDQVKAIRDFRLSDMALSWQTMNPQADPFAESSIKANLEHQIKFLGNPNISLNELVRSGRVRLLPNQVQKESILRLESLESGVEYAQALDATLRNAGPFAPYLMEQLGRDKKDGGIGLEPSAYFNKIFLQSGQPQGIRNNILENLRSSVRNREENNRNFGVLGKGIPKVDFQRRVRTHQSIKDFNASYPKNIPGISAFVDSSIDMVEGYTLEMLSRDPDLDVQDAIDTAVSQLIDFNYVFLDPDFSGGTGRKVRIPRGEMRDLTPEQMEDALSVYVKEAYDSIQDPRIRETAEDREWAWFNNPDDTGFKLYTRTPDLQSWAAVGGDLAEISYEKLRVIASLPETTEQAATSTQILETTTDAGLTPGLQKGAKQAGEEIKMGTGTTLWDILGSGFELMEEGGEWFMKSVRPKREYVKKRSDNQTRAALPKKVVEPETNPILEELTLLQNESQTMEGTAGIEKLNEYASIVKERIQLNDLKGAQRYLRLVRAQLAEEKTKAEAMNDLLNFRNSRNQ